MKTITKQYTKKTKNKENRVQKIDVTEIYEK